LSLNVLAYLTVPFLPKIEIGQSTANLKDGITIQVGIPLIVTGSLNFHLEGQYQLYCDVKLNSIVGNFDKDVFLFKIP
jgi:hypothetical protein